jgi:tetratricopeptide (TPR) repeat protein
VVIIREADRLAGRMEGVDVNGNAAPLAGGISIAGHARSQGLIVVTDNIWAFQRVEGLRSEDRLAPHRYTLTGQRMAVIANAWVHPSICGIALEELGRPQELAPTFGLPKVITAWCWGQRAAHRFSPAPERDRERSCQLAHEAYDLAPNDALSLTLSSGALVLAHRLEEADRWLERALALDPWLACAWIRRGWMSAYFGDSDAAIRELSIALHLMPFEPLRHLSFIGMGCAHFAAGQYDRAVLWVQSGVKASPGSFWAQRIAVAAAALIGERAEARRMGRLLMRKDPDLTIEEARQAWPFRPASIARLAEGLEIAGLPRA